MANELIVLNSPKLTFVSFFSFLFLGSWFTLYMHLNGQRVDETRFLSGYIHDNGHQFYDQGSRTMVSHKQIINNNFCSDLPLERGRHHSYWCWKGEFWGLLQACCFLHIAHCLGLLIVLNWFELDYVVSSLVEKSWIKLGVLVITNLKALPTEGQRHILENLLHCS